jgi:hypothetical protein
MEAIYSCETSVGTQRTTRRYITEDGTLLNRCENFKSYTVIIYLKNINDRILKWRRNASCEVGTEFVNIWIIFLI